MEATLDDGEQVLEISRSEKTFPSSDPVFYLWFYQNADNMWELMPDRSSMNFENRWVLKSALNFESDREVVREVDRKFHRKGPEKAKADLAKECLTRVKKKREEEDDRKPGRLGRQGKRTDMEIDI
ncbi:hypothetical protein HELRODRAFT_166089 [Helobdella robusta]|uniref:Uncharacterized protein n=1 Tax=Helobdella robusta TaxID=6412 RepID=T1EXQ8_HELRO|nr:hypothetical protein HELRODRAFT_166089 [Helobdella robusta]ESN90422.1 hypothetical protein HELRODRAFT_166089 [Helobdella robusta]